MAAAESKPESLPAGRIGGLDGVCPRCRKGELRGKLPGKYVSMQRRRQGVESINRSVYRCNNTECDYENVALIFEM